MKLRCCTSTGCSLGPMAKWATWYHFVAAARMEGQFSRARRGQRERQLGPPGEQPRAAARRPRGHAQRAMPRRRHRACKLLAARGGAGAVQAAAVQHALGFEGEEEHCISSARLHRQALHRALAVPRRPRLLRRRLDVGEDWREAGGRRGGAGGFLLACGTTARAPAAWGMQAPRSTQAACIRPCPPCLSRPPPPHPSGTRAPSPSGSRRSSHLPAGSASKHVRQPAHSAFPALGCTGAFAGMVPTHLIEKVVCGGQRQDSADRQSAAQRPLSSPPFSPPPFPLPFSHRSAARTAAL